MGGIWALKRCDWECERVTCSAKSGSRWAESKTAGTPETLFECCSDGGTLAELELPAALP